MEIEHSLLLSFWADLQQPSRVVWQVVALISCLLIAWGIDRRFSKRRAELALAENRKQHLSERWLRRLIFPFSALVLLLLMRPILSNWQNVSLFDLAVPLLTSLAAIRTVFFALRLGIPRAVWLGSFERVFAALVWLVLALHIIGFLPQVINFLASVKLGIGSQQISVLVLLQGITSVLIGLLLALWLGGLISTRLMAAESLEQNLREVFARLAKAFLILLSILIGLPLAGIDLTMLSVFGGALGVGLGFGLQKIAANYISGFIILLDRSIRIGDMIQVEDKRGVVTNITTRYSVLLSRNGLEMIVPNEMLIGSIIINEMHSTSQVRVPLPVQVAYGTNLERTQKILIECALATPRVLQDPIPKAHVTAFADSGINLELRLWISDPEQGLGQVRSDVYLAIWRAFEAEGIQVPFPQREVRIINESLPSFDHLPD